MPRLRRRTAPSTFAPAGPVTLTALGLLSDASTSYSTASSCARVIQTNERRYQSIKRTFPTRNFAIARVSSSSTHLSKRAEPIRLERRLVYEDLIRAVVRDDEPEPLDGVEPFHLRRRQHINPPIVSLASFTSKSLIHTRVSHPRGFPVDSAARAISSSSARALPSISPNPPTRASRVRSDARNPTAHSPSSSNPPRAHRPNARRVETHDDDVHHHTIRLPRQTPASVTSPHGVTRSSNAIVSVSFHTARTQTKRVVPFQMNASPWTS